MAYDESTLDLLTEEERAALEDDEDGDIEAGDDAAQDEEGRAEEGEESAAEVGDAAASATDEEAEPEEAAAPVLVATAPDDLDTQIANLAEQKESLVEQFDNGELTAREYQKQLDELAKQEREIERVKFKAELAADMQRQAQANEWAAEVKRFTTEHAQYGNEYAWNALDQAVRKIANAPENASLTGRQILEKAHGDLSKAFGWQERKAESAVKVKHAAPPPTLSKMPAAELNDTNGNRFAALDRLMDTDPLGYEAALGKMSKADRDAYLASA